jgi:hypothetical protein
MAITVRTATASRSIRVNSSSMLELPGQVKLAVGTLISVDRAANGPRSIRATLTLFDLGVAPAGSVPVECPATVESADLELGGRPPQLTGKRKGVITNITESS